MLQIYNTLTKQKEIFSPLQSDKVGMYVCGVTVYDFCHLGHARTYLAFDIIVRYLRWRNYKVYYVRNITDIDDKIIKRAHEKGEEYTVLTRRFIDSMHEDFAALKLILPDQEPRATEYITHMIELIKKIIQNEHAYVASNGDVYFDVRSFKNYGCLSHHDIEQLASGARVEVSEAKRDPLDFVLWKLAKPDEPAWDSPWGKGRPGWHMECSAMSLQFLGEHFDIHGGGQDLIFPHHENEIAQTQAGTQQSFVNVWMHGGYLQMEQEKMSKSLGNVITIRDALCEYSPEVLRYFFIASHYRSPLIYSTDALQYAQLSLDRLYTALRFLPPAEKVPHTSFEEQFIQAMDDDFNTPIALSVLFDLSHEVNRLRDEKNQSAAGYGALLKYLGGVLGILQIDPDEFLKSGHTVDAAKIEEIISKRQTARNNKNWAEADRLRMELKNMGITIEDSPTGTIWKSDK